LVYKYHVDTITIVYPSGYTMIPPQFNKIISTFGGVMDSQYGDSGETEQDSARKNLAENSSVGPVEDVSEDFSQMNRGTDVITEK
jgi:hypothetical protein